ncbi:UNVERIFIED_CONTAM: hypothetical protein NCL1_10951 [Trichonephila clavipes]
MLESLAELHMSQLFGPPAGPMKNIYNAHKQHSVVSRKKDSSSRKVLKESSLGNNFNFPFGCEGCFRAFLDSFNDLEALSKLLSTESCKCKKYRDYIEDYHQHVVTGDLVIVKDDLLRNFMEKGTDDHKK